MMRTSKPGRYFYDIPEHQSLLKNWLTNQGPADTFARLMKKYYQHREAHRPDTLWASLKCLVRPQHQHPWQHGTELIAWGLHQPWASSIDINHAINSLPREFNNEWATLHERIPASYQQPVAQAVSRHMPINVSATSMLYLVAWANLHQYAHPSELPPINETNWQIVCWNILQGSAGLEPNSSNYRIAEQTNLLHTNILPAWMLQPHAVWRIMTRYLHPSVWVANAPSIHAMYGPKEMDLFYRLPYMAPSKNNQNSIDIGHHHQRLMQTFCPTLYPALMAMLSPHDWSNAWEILTLGSSMTSTSLTTAPSEIELPAMHMPTEP